MEAKAKVCLALDVDSLQTAKKLVSKLAPYVGVFKIGLQLFIKEGPKAVKAVQDLGGKVFLDLKLHDIPHTVSGAGRAIAALGVDIFDLHATGGLPMMKEAVRAVEEETERRGIKKPLILGVTVLTSIDETILKNELQTDLPLTSYVRHLAILTKQARLNGVVASPQEIRLIREACGKKFVILTPGIRPTWAATASDQRRVMTPKEAFDAGADFIVLGRPILQAKDPIVAARRVIEEIEGNQ